MTKIQIILGSTRQGRIGRSIADWVTEVAKKNTDAEFELVDLADWKLPLFDEPTSPMMGRRDSEHSSKWSEQISKADGFIFVTPEYNHSFPAALKNALDYLNAEWANKPVALVSYGFAGGTRAIESLHPVLAELLLRPVKPNVNITIGMNNYSETGQLVGLEEIAQKNEATLSAATASVVAWAEKLSKLRA
jgi:NAD(P)H-dependent FMN reductase